jgi:predicted acyltransferase
MTAVASETPKPVREQGTSPAPARLTSLDAYRGLVMLLMMAEALDLSRVAQAVPGSALWKFLAHHQSHAEWIGCSLHDLIQPSFSFLVGVALPFSLASRAARGQSRTFMTLHEVRWLATTGVVCLAAGGALGWLGVCPIVKRIWTPS